MLGGGPRDEPCLSVVPVPGNDKTNEVFFRETRVPHSRFYIEVAERFIKWLFVVVGIPVQIKLLIRFDVSVQWKLHVDHEPARFENAMTFRKHFSDVGHWHFVQHHRGPDKIDAVVIEFE